MPIQLITGLRIAEMAQRQGEGGYVQRRSYREKEKKSGGGGGEVGGQGRCERRSEAFVKIQNFFFFFFFWGGGGGGSRIEVEGGQAGCENSKKKIGGGGVQGGCELRSEAFVKIQKKNWGGSGWGVSGWMGTEN